MLLLLDVKNTNLNHQFRKKTMKTALYDEHLALKAKIVDFAGWKMPLLYTGIIPEHQHTRTRASIFDICHMGEFELKGPTAEADLERLLTQPIGSLSSGAGSYGFMLNEKGGVIDDLVCFRLADDCFWLVVNAGNIAKDAAWIKEHISDSTSFNDLSASLAKIDIQGPESYKVLTQLFPGQVPELKYFRFQKVTWQGTSGLLSRTGYTGELGYEFYFPLTKASEFWKLFLENSLLKPAGLGARDTLRVEIGYTLYGHELTLDRTPAGATQGRFMDFHKSFIGKEAVQQELESDKREVLVGLQLAGRMAARNGDQVFAAENPIGTITSGLFSPSLNSAIALAYIEQSSASPGTKLAISSRNRLLEATVISLPFYKEGTARRKISSIS